MSLTLTPTPTLTLTLTRILTLTLTLTLILTSAHGHLQLESRASEDLGQGGLDLSGAALLRGASCEGEGPRSLHGAALVVEPEPMRARGLPPGADQHPQHPQHAQAEVFVLDSDDEGLPALSRD